MSARLKFMLITDAVPLAQRAEACGVDRIFVDREWLGKAERQGHLDTHKASHSLAAVAELAMTLTTADLMVRINPPGPQLAGEVEAALGVGAKRLMLPMFHTVDELKSFTDAVAGRVPMTPLFETPGALACLPECLELFGPRDSVHFGLNDLAIARGDRFLFQPWARGDLDGPAAACREAGVAFGIGGVARIGQGEVPAECIIGEHLRLGSEWVILSRAFRDGEGVNIAIELDKLRAVEAEFRTAGQDALDANHSRFVARVRESAG